MMRQVTIIIQRLSQDVIDSQYVEQLSIRATNSVYSCARCGKEFPTKNHLKEHLRFTHEIYENNNLPPLDYKCDHCGKVFNQICFFHDHWLYRQPPKFNCTKCPQKFRFEHEVRKHLLKQHNIVAKPKLHSCRDCGKTFKSAYYLTIHSAFHKPPQFSCTDCGKKFFLWRNLQGHIGHAHRGKRFERGNKVKSARFTCSVCQKHFATASHLHNHSVMHKPKQFKCSMCEAEFVRPFQLDQHLSSAHSIEVTKKIKCDICQKEFPTRTGLFYHKKFHSSPTVACSKCDCKFYTQSGHTTHVKSHHSQRWKMPTEISTMEPTYTCALCCRPFGVKKAGRTRLRAHLCIHYQKPVDCHICQRIFNSKDSLSNHLRLTHKFVEKSTKCQVCNREFKTLSGLQVHSKYHNPPQYHCSHCQETFYTAAFLATHSKREHIKWPMPTVFSTEDPSYNCAICCRPLLRENLLSHLRIHYQKGQTASSSRYKVSQQTNTPKTETSKKR